jgi:GNAT superfamily N-acetyltransferase
MPLYVNALNSAHDRTGFDSGVPALDGYLKTQAGQDMKRNLSSVFVLTKDRINVIGYYTLSQYSLGVTDLPKPEAKKLPPKRKVPCTLLGRLAVDRRHQGMNYGAALLFHALNKAEAISREIASFAVIVDAKDENAARFYQKYDFTPFDAAPLRLFIPIKGLKHKLKNTDE